MSVDEMQPGEIARSLKRLEGSQAFQTKTLGEIKEQTIKTNGRVTTLEREMREVRHARRAEGHEAKRVTDRPDLITFTIPASAISAKTISTVVAAVLAGLIAAWKAGVL